MSIRLLHNLVTSRARLPVVVLQKRPFYKVRPLAIFKWENTILQTDKIVHGFTNVNARLPHHIMHVLRGDSERAFPTFQQGQCCMFYDPNSTTHNVYELMVYAHASPLACHVPSSHELVSLHLLASPLYTRDAPYKTLSIISPTLLPTQTPPKNSLSKIIRVVHVAKLVLREQGLGRGPPKGATVCFVSIPT